MRHGRIAAIFWLSNSANAGQPTIFGRIVDNVHCSIGAFRWQSELLSQAIRRGQNSNNIPVGAKDFLLCFEAFMTNQVDNGAYVLPFEELRMQDVETVGGKNSSLGEMISQLAGVGGIA